MTKHVETTLEQIVSLCKRRGFVFQGSEIYGGLAGTWDYGPLGVALKNNIKNLWWRMFVDERADMFGVDAAILMNPKVWEASGHVEGFHDPLVEDSVTHKRYRADHLLEEAGVSAEGKPLAELARLITAHGLKSPDGNALNEPQQFNMMFKTSVGSTEGGEMPVYLRPETAAGMFVNFKNIIDAYHPKLPFGMAQIGKAFRNEIAPRDFVFRVREFEQMEVEYFVRPTDWEHAFEEWRGIIVRYIGALGLPEARVHEYEVPEADRAHYSKRTIDFEYDFPFGRKELYGLAYRTDFDLTQHAKSANIDLTYHDEITGEKFVPHVIEPSLGVDRTILAVLCSAYTEDEMNGEKRTYLKLPPVLAPIKVAFFPLLRNKPDLVEKAKQIRSQFLHATSYQLQAVFDDNGNIGKRYRRQDEIGTPYCVTIDFQTLEDNTVTLRDRDTGTQERVSAEDLVVRIQEALR